MRPWAWLVPFGLVLIVAGTALAGTYDMTTFYPFNTTKTFDYQHAGDFIEHVQHRSWPDGSTFTIHHWFDTWCPRTDDVMRWSGDSLMYLDTYNFSSTGEAALTDTSLRNPGHIWATQFMTGDAAATFNDFSHSIYKITESGCSVTSSTLDSSFTSRVWKRLLESDPDTGVPLTDWSPFTGGSSNIVPVVRLDETTCIQQNCDDFWKEEWFFYQDRTLGWIAIHTIGYRGQPGQPVQVKWNARLHNVY